MSESVKLGLLLDIRIYGCRPVVRQIRFCWKQTCAHTHAVMHKTRRATHKPSHAAVARRASQPSGQATLHPSRWRGGGFSKLGGQLRVDSKAVSAQQSPAGSSSVHGQGSRRGIRSSSRSGSRSSDRGSKSAVSQLAARVRWTTPNVHGRQPHVDRQVVGTQ